MNRESVEEANRLAPSYSRIFKEVTWYTADFLVLNCSPLAIIFFADDHCRQSL
jgi:hypothetical protein